jgi:hypothetical protein
MESPTCAGMRVEMDLDEDRFVGGGVYLFSSVLEHFLAQYVSMNSFSQLAVRTRQRKETPQGMGAESGEPDPALTPGSVAGEAAHQPGGFLVLPGRAAAAAVGGRGEPHRVVRPPVGRGGADWRAHASLSFPPSEIQKPEREPRPGWSAEDDREFLRAHGPGRAMLPTRYTELVHGAPCMRAIPRSSDFLDIFNHRMTRCSTGRGRNTAFRWPMSAAAQDRLHRVPAGPDRAWAHAGCRIAWRCRIRR